MASPINLSFFRTFGAYFDNDVLESWDREYLESEAEACAEAARHDIADLPMLIHALECFLKRWDDETVERFVGASNTDWRATSEAEADLKFIIEHIIRCLKSDG